MKHLGDITKISGYTAPIVDCIIGGSPCQDLSVAGLRKGLEGERSGLFMEQIRIVKEMRKQDERMGRTDVNIRPRYMVWENVPGAFSSNKGEDFRVVLEEIAKVKDKNAIIPMPDKGKWTTAGCIVGDGWSIAWRVLDAQFWGVPQRRRRIALVADFGGESASEILFVRKSMSGHLDESQPKRKDSSTDVTRGTGADDTILLENNQNHATVQTNGICTTLSASMGMGGGYVPMVTQPTYSYNIGDRYGVPAEHKDLSPTLTARCGTGGNNVPAVVQEKAAGFCPEQSAKTRGIGYEEEMSPTLRSNVVPAVIQHSFTMQDREGKEGGGKGALIQEEKSASLRTNNFQYVFQPVPFSKSKRAQSDSDFETWKESDKANTLNGFDTGDVRTSEVVCYQEKVGSQYVEEDKLVVCKNEKSFVDVEMEVAVRKYEVDTKLLCECLRDHKGKFTNKEIAEALDKPLTLVEHWFRKDNCFSVPDADIWFDLKKLLGIETTEFDQAITEFEYKSGNYDMRNRIYTGESSPTLTCGCGDHLHLLPCYTIDEKCAYGFDPSATRDVGQYVLEEKANVLVNGSCPGHHNGVIIKDSVVAVDCRNGTESEVNGALQSNSAHSLNGNNTVRTRYIVRRLTPLECERLQGYPDGWTDIGEYIDSNGKKRQTSDASRYKALGNSIALPPWKWVLKRICACYERDATMASLFDGIGGFPYLWEQLNGKGSCLWASEIEEFPMAVTKVRIGE